MATITAKDVKQLRDATGVGMMDAKNALVATEGDFDAAGKWLLERGLAKSAERADRENSQGCVAVATGEVVATLVQLRSETDFVAKSPDFTALAQALADAVAARGEGAVAELAERLDELKITLKENIDVGTVVRFEAAPGNVLDTYLHVQAERGVNGVIVEIAGGDAELAHEVAVSIAFNRPAFLTREEVPAEVVAEQRAVFETQTRNEGKPEAAMEKIVTGKLTGFFKEVGKPGSPKGVLVDQAYPKDDKQSIQQFLGGATIVRFAQVEIGA
ncbi:MAG: Translation elongation factor Ts [uncultured Acidimicrobiales bacterium]|uniref:Elongation factor Ts n=1 Tax=uncultured Acidimicrobiales bacterium TaxID=310071 RepID=A0A6J4IK22_9ACTN|nr:MAG: Translation elongation factor Ts [uncultured Acidimicrobiales bacterium]